MMVLPFAKNPSPRSERMYTLEVSSALRSVHFHVINKSFLNKEVLVNLLT